MSEEKKGAPTPQGNSSDSKESRSQRPSFTGPGSSIVRVDLENPDPQVVDVISRHLVQPQDITSTSVTNNTNNKYGNSYSSQEGTPSSVHSSSMAARMAKRTLSNSTNTNNNNNNILASSLGSNADYSLHLKGGDITRDLYKWQSQHGNLLNNTPNNNVASNTSMSNVSLSDKMSGSLQNNTGILNLAHNPRRRSLSFNTRMERDSFSGRSMSRSGSYNSLNAGSFTSQHIDNGFSTPKGISFSSNNNNNNNNAAHHAGDGSMTNKVQLPNTETSNEHDLDVPMMSVNEMRAPNGFRRSFILNKQLEQHRKLNTKKKYQPPNFLTRNFIEFLTIYGHFAGEDLSDEDDEESGDEGEIETDDEEEYNSDTENAVEDDDEETGESIVTETTSLLPRYTKKLSLSNELTSKINQKIKSKMLQRQKAAAKESHGNKKATNFKATLLLIKSFVGTGVLFLPKSFDNAGYMFAVACLAVCSVLSYYCFVILIISRNSLGSKIRLGYGELGQALYGNFFQTAILQSIILSQIGFASAYIVFTATNLQQFFQSFMSVTYPLSVYIFTQMLVFVPLGWTRNISKLSGTALIADLFILIGLIYVFYYSSFHIYEQGGISPSIIPFNNETWSLFIGTAIFTFEGIGLLIPIQDSMKKPQDFPKLLAYVLAGSTLLFIACGLVCYFSYGADVQTVILLNFPSDSIMTQTTQFLYAIAILLSTPLQLFPAIRILENQYFFPKKSGKHNPKIKWMKNNFRTLIVTLSCFIAYFGANDLDKFVSLVGSLACIPLIYVYPPLMHAKTHPKYKYLDWGVCALGIGMMAYTTSQTILMWLSE